MSKVWIVVQPGWYEDSGEIQAVFFDEKLAEEYVTALGGEWWLDIREHEVLTELPALLFELRLTR